MSGGGSTVALADFNQDGNLDIVSAPYLGSTVTVWLGNGDGTFASGTSYSAGSATYYVATADLNNDGYPDIVVSGNTSGTVTILLNNVDWSAPSGGKNDHNATFSSTSTTTTGTTERSAASQTVDAVFGTQAKNQPIIPTIPCHNPKPEGNWLDSAAAAFLSV
jgi:hypothetical protein